MERKPNTNTGKQRRMMKMLTDAGLQGRRHAICWEFSNEETESSKDLTEVEVDAIIAYLEREFAKMDASDKMRKKMISLARQMNWEIKVGRSTKCDMDRLNAWCMKYGQFGKELNHHTYTELTALVTQFKKAYAHFLSAI